MVSRIACRPAVVAQFINTKIKNCLLLLFNMFLFIIYTPRFRTWIHVYTHSPTIPSFTPPHQKRTAAATEVIYILIYHAVHHWTKRYSTYIV